MTAPFVNLRKITEPPSEELLDCPICGADPVHAGCLHVWCDDCSRWTELNEPESHAGPGFAGGMIYHLAYRCGHRYDDESDDVEAAR